MTDYLEDIFLIAGMYYQLKFYNCLTLLFDKPRFNTFLGTFFWIYIMGLYSQHIMEILWFCTPFTIFN